MHEVHRWEAESGIAGGLGANSSWYGGSSTHLWASSSCVLLTLRPSPLLRAGCFNSKRTSFHVALELEHVESVDMRSAKRKADAVLPAFAREGQRGHTVKRVARRGRCRLLFLLGVQHIYNSPKAGHRGPDKLKRPVY